MCDFSLHAVDNRLAVKGDQLFVHMFRFGSKGLASKTDFEAARPRVWKRVTAYFLPPAENPLRALPAVCVPPGARLRLSGIPKYIQDKYGASDSEDVTFVQTTYETFRYRDGVRFGNGRVAMLQVFPEGVRAEVLRLGAEEEPETAPVETDTGLRFDAIRSVE